MLNRDALWKFISKTRLYKFYLKHNYKPYKHLYEEEHRKLQYLLEHFDLKDMKPARGYLRKRQRDIMDFAENVFQELDCLSIRPFLIGGCLVGWVRHGGFVPWDDDLDFGLLRSDWYKLLNYAEKNWTVLEYQGERENFRPWVDEITHKYAGQYILLVFAEHIQISRGTSCLDRKSIDFFSYDYYNENLQFEVHLNYIKNINNKLCKCKNSKERLDIVRDAIRDENAIVDESSNIYFGMDSSEPYSRMFNSSWIDYETIFPLKKIVYEGKSVSIPNKPEIFLKYYYPNFKELPNDFGKETHDYWKEYKTKNFVCVEFYLVDNMEIAHFLPFYEFFREKGIYAIFVAEPPEINASSSWFDYEKVIDTLTAYEIEFNTICNPNAEFAFTTQRADCLRKYKNKKINIVCGCGLIKGQFAYSLDALEGFDYKFVHGDFCKELCRRNLLSNEWEEYKDKIYLMGYPKYPTAYLTHKLEVEDIKKELGIKTDKRIISYLPTGGEHTCIEEFYEAIMELKEKYYIIIKPHHCTARIVEEKENLKMLTELADLLLPAEYDTKKILEVSELVICSAESDAALECSWLKMDIKAIYITKEFHIEDSCWQELNKVAKVVNVPQKLLTEVDNIMIEDPYIEWRKKFVNSVFGDSRDYLSLIYKTIFAKDMKQKMDI